MELKGKQELYSTLYKVGSEVFKMTNACGIRKDPISGKCSCENTRRNPAYEATTRVGELCCSDCNHLGPEGCTVEALACKLWTCGRMADWAPSAVISISHLRRVARESGIHLSVRATKEECFKK